LLDCARSDLTFDRLLLAVVIADELLKKLVLSHSLRAKWDEDLEQVIIHLGRDVLLVSPENEPALDTIRVLNEISNQNMGMLDCISLLVDPELHPLP